MDINDKVDGINPETLYIPYILFGIVIIAVIFMIVDVAYWKTNIATMILLFLMSASVYIVAAFKRDASESTILYTVATILFILGIRFMFAP